MNASMHVFQDGRQFRIEMSLPPFTQAGLAAGRRDIYATVLKAIDAKVRELVEADAEC